MLNCTRNTLQSVRRLRSLTKKIIIRLSRAPIPRKIVGKLPINMRISLVSFAKRTINPSSTFMGFKSVVGQREQHVDRIFNSVDWYKKWSQRSRLFHTKKLSHPPERMKDSYSCSAIIQNNSFLTVDMWDTLIGRYRPAEAVKRNAAMYLSLEDWRMNDYNGERISVGESLDSIFGKYLCP